MNKIILILASVFLLLGCGTSPEVIPHKDGTYILRHTNGRMLIPGSVSAQMLLEADKLCAKSWRKLDERHLNEGDWGVEEWAIKCL